MKSKGSGVNLNRGLHDPEQSSYEQIRNESLYFQGKVKQSNRIRYRDITLQYTDPYSAQSTATEQDKV